MGPVPGPARAWEENHAWIERYRSAVLLVLAAGAQAQTLLERGSYLVNGIMTCNHCHTPKDKAGDPVMVKGANITSHPTRGIGSWSDAEIKRALTDGVSRDGRPLANTMPWRSTRSIFAA
jgi:hypothetical protein